MGRAPSASAPGEAREAGDAPSALQLRAEAVAQCLEQGSIYEGELGFSAEWTCDDAMWFYVGEADNDECEEWILTWPDLRPRDSSGYPTIPLQTQEDPVREVLLHCMCRRVQAKTGSTSQAAPQVRQ